MATRSKLIISVYDCTLQIEGRVIHNFGICLQWWRQRRRRRWCWWWWI